MSTADIHIESADMPSVSSVGSASKVPASNPGSKTKGGVRQINTLTHAEKTAAPPFREVAMGSAARKDFSGKVESAVSVTASENVPASNLSKKKGTQQESEKITSKKNMPDASLVADFVYMFQMPSSPTTHRKFTGSGADDQSTRSVSGAAHALSDRPTTDNGHSLDAVTVEGVEKSIRLSALNQGDAHIGASIVDNSSGLDVDNSTLAHGGSPQHGSTAPHIQRPSIPLETIPISDDTSHGERKSSVSSEVERQMEKSKPRLTTAFTRHQKSRALSASRLSSPILKPAVSFPHAALLGDVGGNGTAITAAGLPSVANSNVALQVQAAQSTALSTGASQTEGLNPVGSTPDGQVLHLDTSGWQAVLASQAGRLRPGQSLLVRTNPASLGPIQVEAVHSGQGKHFHIQLTANHSDTIRMLQQGAPLIAQQISGVGTNTITQITVSDAATFSQAFFSSSQENSRQPNKDGTPTQTRRLSTGLVENVRQKVGDSSIVQDVTGFESWI